MKYVILILHGSRLPRMIIMLGYSTAPRKDMTDMSFVGINNTNEGLIGFADSKASLMHNNGCIEEDMHRGNIHKLFKNDKFIFVTYGNNELFNIAVKENLEDYVMKHLTKDISYEDFFDNMYHNLLRKKPEYNTGIYTFIIGAKDSLNRYYVRRLRFDALKEIYELSKRDYTKNCTFGGDNRYTKIFELIPTYFDYPLEKSVEIIQKQVEKLIEIFDLDARYNPVGMPVVIEVFK